MNILCREGKFNEFVEDENIMFEGKKCYVLYNKVEGEFTIMVGDVFVLSLYPKYIRAMRKKLIVDGIEIEFPNGEIVERMVNIMGGD